MRGRWLGGGGWEGGYDYFTSRGLIYWVDQHTMDRGCQNYTCIPNFKKVLHMNLEINVVLVGSDLDIRSQ